MKALITGASSGIGRDMARVLSKKGYDLVLVARDREKLNLLKDELTTNIKVVAMDLSIAENCKKLHAENPDIDLLINNAGFGDCGNFMATYYATKSYIVRLSEGIREELNKENSNVKISILCPGPVSTNFNKVANVKFSLKEANSYKVAKYAINHLNSFYIVPGLDIKLARLGAHIFPSNLIAKITYMVQKRKLQ